MKATQTRPQQPIDWQARCNLAASILNQREPSHDTAMVARMALNGCSIDYIRKFEADVAASRAQVA